MAWVQYFWKWLVTASTVPIRITEIIVLFITIGALAISQIRPEWVGKMDKLAWQIPLGVLIAVFLISLAVSSYNLYTKQQGVIDDLNQQLDAARKQAYPPITTLMMESFFKDKDIPLGEFGLVNPQLTGKTFEDCRLHGPIVIGIGNEFTMTYCSFTGSPETHLIVTTNEYVGGVLVVERCTFINCTFVNVSFIGNAERIAKIKEGFGISD